MTNDVFWAGERVVIAAGPYWGAPGIFIRLRDDPHLAYITERNGHIRSHPVEWMLRATSVASGFHTVLGHPEENRSMTQPVAAWEDDRGARRVTLRISDVSRRDRGLTFNGADKPTGPRDIELDDPIQTRKQCDDKLNAGGPKQMSAKEDNE